MQTYLWLFNNAKAKLLMKWRVSRDKRNEINLIAMINVGTIYIVYAYETNLKGHKINRKYLYLVCEKNIKCFFDIVCEKQRFIGINPST